jgi:hypothetical protein
MSSGVKLLNLVVTLFVYRKQKEISLTLSTLEISALPHLIALNLFPRLGHLGAASSFGKLIILAFQNSFGQSVELVFRLTGEHWILTNIYAPCTPEGQLAFLIWFKNIEMPTETKWLIVGDFNLLRAPENRNKLGGSVTEMFAFNTAITSSV